MKKIIFAAVFMITISGFAAAQSTSAKPATKKSQTTTVKKDSKAKSNTKSTVPKQEASRDAKSDVTAVKLVLPMSAAIPDSAAVPRIKNNKE